MKLTKHLRKLTCRGGRGGGGGGGGTLKTSVSSISVYSRSALSTQSSWLSTCSSQQSTFLSSTLENPASPRDCLFSFWFSSSVPRCQSNCQSSQSLLASLVLDPGISTNSNKYKTIITSHSLGVHRSKNRNEVEILRKNDDDLRYRW